MLLEGVALNVRFAQTHAVRDVDLTVDAGEIVAILGANGAGKSSLLRALLGDVRIASGTVRLAGHDVTRAPIAERMRRGLVLVPEGRRILVSLTVHENLLLGAYARRDGAAVAREIDALYGRFPNLAQRRAARASVLSGGEQQMLAIGRAVLAQPRLLMLDEPSLGLSPLLVEQLFAYIRELNAAGMACLLVEQNAAKALQSATRAYVLELGRVRVAGPAATLLTDASLRAAYLGAAAS